MRMWMLMGLAAILVAGCAGRARVVTRGAYYDDEVYVETYPRYRRAPPAYYGQYEYRPYRHRYYQPAPRVYVRPPPRVYVRPRPHVVVRPPRPHVPPHHRLPHRRHFPG